MYFFGFGKTKNLNRRSKRRSSRAGGLTEGRDEVAPNRPVRNFSSEERTVTRRNEKTFEQQTNEDGESAENKADMKVRYKLKMTKELPILFKQEFYHGLMTREEIKEMLHEEGEFLVRKTEVGKGANLFEKFAMSVRWTGRDHHVLLKLNKEDKWHVMPENAFDSVTEMVNFYMSTQKAVQTEGTKLLKVVKRPEWYILHENISTSKKLGSGAFGDVFLADMSGTQVAVKTLKGKLGKAERSTFMKEASINRRFNHPNVARLLGVAAQYEPVMVVLEFCAGGQLKSHCKEKPELTIKDLSKYLFEAAKGMEYLSNMNVIHRDLAARNCLLSADFVCKIADFGLSCSTNEAQEQKKMKMPVKWIAPEILQRMEFSTKTDVYAFGIMMWEVYSRCQSDPYPSMNNTQVKALVLAGKRMDPPAEAPELAKKLMTTCWASESEKRPTFAQIVEEYKKFPELAGLKLSI